MISLDMSSARITPETTGVRLGIVFWLAVIAVFLATNVVIETASGAAILSGELRGTDSYMRLLRVTQLHETGDWFDLVIPRSNAPYGEQLHWTRPFDILLLIVAAPVALFAGWGEGLFWAAVVVSPLLLLACGLAMIWTMAPLIRPSSWLLPAIAILIQPGIVAYSTLGRADHHVLLLLVHIFSIGCMLRGLKNRFDLRIFFICGLFSGFAVWLSVETLLSVLAIATALGIAWLLSPENRARQGVLYALGMLLVMALGIVSAHPPSRWLTPVYDEIGAVHLLIAVLLLAFWSGILLLERSFGRPKTWPEALGLAALFGLVAAGAIYRCYPGFFGGPMVDVNPAIVHIWLDKVSEMKGILPTTQYSLGKFIFYLGQGLVALPFLVWKLWKERDDPAYMAWMGLTVAVLLYWPVATLHVRFSSFAEVLFVLVLAELIDRILRALEDCRGMLPRVLGKSAAICLILVASVAIGNLLMTAGQAEDHSSAEKTAADVCDLAAMSRFLESADNWPADKRLTILGFLDFGPELLYRTRHRVIATPYHRNDEGILDSYKIMTAGDPAEAKAMMDRRAVDLVLLCPNSPERGFFSTPDRSEHLYASLAADNPPDWLAPVALPEALRGEFKLYEKVF